MNDQRILPHSDLAGTTVYVLRYWHRHGSDITVHASREGADAQIAGYVREWWVSERYGNMPETPDLLSDDAAVQMYFDAQNDYASEPEGYEIHDGPVRP